MKITTVVTLLSAMAIGLAGCAREGTHSAASTPPTLPSSTASSTASGTSTASSGAPAEQSRTGSASRSAGSTSQTMLTGCLNPGDSTGSFVLTDENGKKTTVSGANLEKHSGHKVTLTGTMGTNGDFKVTHIRHLAETCQAPTR